MNRLVIPAVALGTLVATGCTYQQGLGGSQQPVHTASAMAEIDRALTGRIAGPPLHCLPTYRAGDMNVVDENTILYRDGATTYRNDPPGGCHGLGRPGNAMVSRPLGSQLCSGDIIQVVDTRSGMYQGGCTLGDFVPFRRPPS